MSISTCLTSLPALIIIFIYQHEIDWEFRALSSPFRVNFQMPWVAFPFIRGLIYSNA